MEEALYFIWEREEKKVSLPHVFMCEKLFFCCALSIRDCLTMAITFFIAFEGFLMEILQIWEIYENNNLKNGGSNP